VHFQGKVNEGTFGVVFKAIKASEKTNYDDAVSRNQVFQNFFAIKKPKNNAREGEGFNKDAVREIALLMELKRAQSHSGTGWVPNVAIQPLKDCRNDTRSTQLGVCRSSKRGYIAGRHLVYGGRRPWALLGLRLGRV
jgi:hypothetical protein